MELKKITDSVYYIPNPSNIGAIIEGKDCILIDTGLDSQTGKNILSLLSKEEITVKAIVNTHSHADHYGGNKIIKEKTGCKVLAPSIEASIIENPILEPLCFFSGASPIKELKNKFLMAEACKVDEIISTESIKIEGFALKVIPLPGHSINQIGIAYNNALFCADSFFSKETIEKHKIPFFSNIKETKKTLEFLKNSSFENFIPAHLLPQKEIQAVIEENLKCIVELELKVIELLSEKKSTEQVLSDLCNALGISTNSIQQHYLLKTAVMAYLEELSENGKIKPVIENNKLNWIRV
jgi:glyoxylase-like metal-dependent hydrolase (beta-lactamase superfamily II)